MFNKFTAQKLVLKK